LAGTLVEHISSRLKELENGGYLREYVKGGRRYRTSLQAAVADILDALAIRKAENVAVPGTKLTADFEVNGKFVFVDRELSGPELRSLGRLRRKCILIRPSPMRSDRQDSGLRVVEIGRDDAGDLQTIFLDDPSFNFDYAHILPGTRKCSVMHGHTSSALVEIIGRPVDGMVVDFGLAKDVIKDSIGSLDHKLFISRRYVVREDARTVTLRFRTVHGDFAIQAPKGTTVLLEGEATVENLARELLSRISPRMPENVTAVGVYVYEGLNKGAHILAQLHKVGDEGARRRP
jgi:6-pyruvoyltetrahydropterin/6-carboxytetrahydropterin synthase